LKSDSVGIVAGAGSIDGESATASSASELGSAFGPEAHPPTTRVARTANADERWNTNLLGRRKTGLQPRIRRRRKRPPCLEQPADAACRSPIPVHET
jgi:hypothetical protein